MSGKITPDHRRRQDHAAAFNSRITSLKNAFINQRQ
jgi:hypothetical protein